MRRTRRGCSLSGMELTWSPMALPSAVRFRACSSYRPAETVIRGEAEAEDAPQALEALTQFVFSENGLKAAREDWDTYLSVRCILTPIGRMAASINTRLLGQVHGEEHEYTSADNIEHRGDEDGLHVAVGLLHALAPSGFPPHTPSTAQV
jgi:hypothetical protein